MIKKLFFLTLLFKYSLSVNAQQIRSEMSEDVQTQLIISQILKKKMILEQKTNTAVEFAVFMDFDGTIIDGDITDGMKTKDGKTVYMGLAEASIRRGLWNPPEGVSNFDDYLKAFEHKLEKNHADAYAWSASAFANLPPPKEAKLKVFVKEWFRDVLSPHMFKSSVSFIRQLSEKGIKVFVVSASPTIFVEGAVTAFPEIPLNRVFGVNRNLNKDGQLVDHIVNYAEGKVQRIESVLARNPNLVVLGGFGNSWGTDGRFLDWISRNKDGVSLMINGGKKPQEYNDSHIIETLQTQVKNPIKILSCRTMISGI